MIDLTIMEDRLVRGGFHNLSLAATRGSLIRAVFEGVAYNSRWLKRYIEKFIRRPLTELRFVGGGARSELWCQVMADVLGCTIHQVRNPVETG